MLNVKKFSGSYFISHLKISSLLKGKSYKGKKLLMLEMIQLKLPHPDFLIKCQNNLSMIFFWPPLVYYVSISFSKVGIFHDITTLSPRLELLEFSTPLSWSHFHTLNSPQIQHIFFSWPSSVSLVDPKEFSYGTLTCL